MQKLEILYAGCGSGTSRHRALALERLGHEVTPIDPRRLLPAHRAVDFWIHHTGGVLLDRLISNRLPRRLGQATFDLLWVDGGALLTPELVRQLRDRCRFAINYNIDDPFGGRDGRKWRNYLAALDVNDLVVVVRKANVDEALRAGARNAMRVHMSADEVAHAPRQLTAQDHVRWDSRVLFAGTWMPERGPFLARLVRLGVPLAIFGDRWHKAKEWPELRDHWRGPGVYNDDEYAKAVQCAEVCLGLLSKGNRDLSTTRSFEIPYLGGVLCAERTTEHLDLYREGVDAVFWSTPEECAEKCGQLLRDAEWRRALSRNGRQRCIRNRTLNEPVLDEILSNVASSRRAAEVMV